MSKTDQAINKCIEAVRKGEYLCVPIGQSATYQSVSAVGQHILVNGGVQESIADRREDLKKVKTDFVGFVAYTIKDKIS